MATIQGQLNTPRDTTIQATNTALGLLGKDASLQDIKTALLQIVAALDPTADDYDQLSNKPQVNGVTLSGNKTSKQLGIRQTIPLTSAQYAQLTSAEKMDVDKDYIITDENATAAPIDDTDVSRNKVWSSYKVNDILTTEDFTFTAGTNVTIAVQNNFVYNNIVHINAIISVSSALSSGSTLLNLPTGKKLKRRCDYQLYTGQNIAGSVNGSAISANTGSGTLSAGTYVLTFDIEVY